MSDEKVILLLLVYSLIFMIVAFILFNQISIYDPETLDGPEPQIDHFEYTTSQLIAFIISLIMVFACIISFLKLDKANNESQGVIYDP